MNRRGFLGSILALSAAPSIVRADSLMRIVPRERLVFAFNNRIALEPPAWIVFSVAHSAETRRKVIDYMEGRIAELPPEAGTPTRLGVLNPPRLVLGTQLHLHKLEPIREVAIYHP